MMLSLAELLIRLLLLGYTIQSLCHTDTLIYCA